MTSVASWTFKVQHGAALLNNSFARGTYPFLGNLVIGDDANYDESTYGPATLSGWNLGGTGDTVWSGAMELTTAGRSMYIRRESGALVSVPTADATIVLRSTADTSLNPVNHAGVVAGGEIDPFTDTNDSSKHLNFVLEGWSDKGVDPNITDDDKYNDAVLRIETGTKEVGRIASYNIGDTSMTSLGGLVEVETGATLVAEQILARVLHLEQDAKFKIRQRSEGGADSNVDELRIDEVVLGQPSAQLDITDNQIRIINNLTEDEVEILVIAGRNGGTWDGQGIMSSLADESSGIAVGYTDDGDPNGPVRALRTYQGDATCDGAVNIYDLIKLQVNYNGTGLNWDDADWTYDGVCNIYDLIKLQVNYGKASLGPFGAGGGGAPVPEPATMALLGLGGLALLRRRRRRQ